MIKKIVISYFDGNPNWYVSEFFKYFHAELKRTSGVEIEYISLKDLALRYGKPFEHNVSSVFNWYNLILLNERTEKWFVHSWYDYAPEMVNFCKRDGFNLVKLSTVSKLTDVEIAKYPNVFQPSVYFLENWSDLQLIEQFRLEPKIHKKIYFNCLAHGIRKRVMEALSEHDGFTLLDKSIKGQYREKHAYYRELSSNKFGLSMNGAAYICYRDLELFGLGVLNLRQPLTVNTYEPLKCGIHYRNFLDDVTVDRILYHGDAKSLIEQKVSSIMEFCDSNEYNDMIRESRLWYLRNCIPENQFKIIASFLEDFTILE